MAVIQGLARAGVAAILAGLAGLGCSGDDEQLLKLEGLNDSDELPLCLRYDERPPAEVSDLPVKVCGEEPHTHEVYRVLPYREIMQQRADEGQEVVVSDVYPGVEALESFARSECIVWFEDYVGLSVFDSRFFYTWILPSLGSWTDEKDDEVLCVLGNRDPEPLPAGTAEGMGAAAARDVAGGGDSETGTTRGTSTGSGGD